MRFTITVIVVLLFNTVAYCQGSVNELPVKKDTINSIATKKQDSLTYATFYFYRSYIPKISASVKKAPIFINDTLVHQLKANQLVKLTINREGRFRIAVDKKNETEISVKVKFGKEYFFKCEVSGGLLNTRITIDPVTVAVGRAESGALPSE